MTTAHAVAAPAEELRAAPAESEALVGLRRSSTFIPELESVRGIAVLLVFTFHVDGFVRFPFVVKATTPLWLAFVRAGHTGVDLFFVLSAFLLSLPFLEDAAGGRRVSLRNYFTRRALRILPLYYTAVVVGALLWGGHLADLRLALPYLFFLNSFARMCTPLDPYSGVWWSLATEIQFYLVLPLLLVFLRSRRGRWAGAVFLGLHALVYAVVVRGGFRMETVQAQMALINSVFGRSPLFLSGILAAAVYHRHGTRLRERLARVAWLRRGGADVLFFALILANALFLRWVVSIGPTRQMGAADQPWHIVNGALWATFVLMVLLAPLRTKRLFSNAVLARLGILSYSIYIIHAPFVKQILWAIRRTWPHTIDTGWTPLSTGVVAVLTAGCFGLSTLSYRFVERPFLVRKARFDS